MIEPLTPPMTGGPSDYREGTGPHLFRRLEPFVAWNQARRSLGQSPEDWDRASMLDLTSTDRLQLASEPAVIDAAAAALTDYGLGGGDPQSRPARALERALAEYLATEHVVLFPSLEAACIGMFVALLRPHDHVVLDERADPCLRIGAAAATRRVHLHEHLDAASLRGLLARLRTHDTGNAVLVVTESLFDTESSVPDLAMLHHACRDFGAFLLVCVANDLGSIGPDGAGALSAQAMLGRIDLIVGSFAPIFAATGGFVATRESAAHARIRHVAGGAQGAGGLPPLQAAVALAALRLVTSSEGRRRRAVLATRAEGLRQALDTHGVRTLGTASPVVLARGDTDDASRFAAALAARHGVRTTLLEPPLVARRLSRLRLRVTTGHGSAQLSQAADLIACALATAADRTTEAPDQARTTASRGPAGPRFRRHGS